jgi:hypothetical protein
LVKSPLDRAVRPQVSVSHQYDWTQDIPLVDQDMWALNISDPDEQVACALGRSVARGCVCAVLDRAGQSFEP